MPVTREELPLQCSAHEYHALMHQGVGRSEDLVNRFLDQIEQHNNLGLMLNAVLSVCPRDVAISQAKALDGERRQGKPRGELHGIPITVKVGEAAGRAPNLVRVAEINQDCIVTGPSLGMVSSAGSSAIASLQATRNATLVDRLLDAGMILLGKGNLTEFCGLKSVQSPRPVNRYTD
jgi:amidase